jgi:hypothetical protein
MQQHNEVELSALGMGSYIIQFYPIQLSECYFFKNFFVEKKQCKIIYGIINWTYCGEFDESYF